MNCCNKCFDNNWEIKAVCQMCGNEEEFNPKEGVTKRLQLKVGDNCPKCPGELFYESKPLTSKRTKKAYHYCKWLKCRQCRCIFMEDKYKVPKGRHCDCPYTPLTRNYMSASLMIQPVKPIEGISLSHELKLAIQDRYFDGSNQVTISSNDREFFEGLKAAGIKDANKVLKLIDKHDLLEIWLEY